QLGRYSERYLINGSGAGSDCYRFSASGPPWQGPPPSPSGAILATFSPYGPGGQGVAVFSQSAGRPDGVYDPLDSFHLPIWGLEGIQRPGPTIVISAC